MIFEELMHKYLDGVLSDSDQTELFHIVSVSPEKRAEFNEYITMRSAMVKDKMSQTVPKGLEQTVLAAAIAAIGSGAAAAAQEIGGIAGTATVMSKLMAVVLITGGLTIGGFLGYALGERNQITAGTNVASAPSVERQPQQQIQNSSPAQAAGNSGQTILNRMYARSRMFDRSHEGIASRSAVVGNTVTGTSQNGVADNYVASSNGTTSQQNTIEKLLFTANVPVTHTVLVPVSLQGTEHITGLISREGITTQNEGWRPRVSVDEDDANDGQLQYQLELQEGGGALFPKFTASNLTPAPLINFTTLRFGMNIWDGAMLGIGVGQSMYSLEYSSQTSTLTTATYLQYSNLWYTGIYLQQLLDPVLGLTPRATFELAGTNIGVLGNVQAGISYPLTKNVYAGINAIVSGLMYRHAGAWLGSQKIGLMFGIGTEF